jgi:RimJ/RimL family protein N-acetyltransferase
VIESARLRLREHRATDLDAYAAMWADPRVTRFIGGKPFSREQSWVRLLCNRGMWAMLGFGFWVVEDRATGEFLGEAGLQELHREIAPTLVGTLECGWGLAPSAQGRGLAREAVKAVLAWADQNLPGKRQTCIIDADHTVSIRLADEFGFRELARTEYHAAPVVIFQRGG